MGYSKLNRRQLLGRGAAVSAMAGAFGGLGGLTAPALARNAAFPSQPVRIVVGFAPGGSTDAIARLVAPYIAEVLGQPVIVENRPGGDGAIAHESLLRSPADGHVMTISNTSLIVSAPHAFTDINVDPINELAHVTMISEGRHVLLSNAALAGRSLSEIVALSQENPGTMVHASTGAGSTNNVSFALLQMQTGARFNTVQYRGTGPIMADLLGDQVHVSIAAESSAEPYITGDRLGGVLSMAPQRLPHLPDVPCSNELGLPDLDRMTFWNGLHAAAGTPADVIALWQDTIAQILTDPGLLERMDSLRLQPIGSTSEAFTAHVHEEYALYGELFRTANILQE